MRGAGLNSPGAGLSGDVNVRSAIKSVSVPRSGEHAPSLGDSLGTGVTCGAELKPKDNTVFFVFFRQGRK